MSGCTQYSKREIFVLIPEKVVSWIYSYDKCALEPRRERPIEFWMTFFMLCGLEFSFMAFYGLECSFVIFYGLLYQNIDFIGILWSFLAVIDPNSFGLLLEITKLEIYKPR